MISLSFSGVFNVNFEHISYIGLVLLLVVVGVTIEYLARFEKPEKALKYIKGKGYSWSTSCQLERTKYNQPCCNNFISIVYQVCTNIIYVN